MGDRDAGRGGHGAIDETPGTTSNVDAGLGERERLLAAAAEDERVAALEAHDVEAAPAERTSSSLTSSWSCASRGDPDRVRGRLADELLGDEPVVDEHVAAADEVEPPRGDQAGVAGAGADERDRHSSDSATSASKKSRRSA